MLFLIACIASFIPYTALFLWLRKCHGDAPVYRALCARALGSGTLATLWILLFSGGSFVLIRLTGIHRSNPLLYQAIYDFIVIALMEELAKYMMFRRVLKRNIYPYSWLDVTILMTIVGIGFGALEAVIYTIDASIPVVLVRGVCLPHAGLGYIVGYFFGKGVKYGKMGYARLGFAISWLIHGLYDFSLSEEFIAVNDNLVFVPLLLAVLDIVLVIKLIRFVKKAKPQELYTETLPGAEAPQPAAPADTAG